VAACVARPTWWIDASCGSASSSIEGDAAALERRGLRRVRVVHRVHPGQLRRHRPTSRMQDALADMVARLPFNKNKKKPGAGLSVGAHVPAKPLLRGTTRSPSAPPRRPAVRRPGFSSDAGHLPADRRQQDPAPGPIRLVLRRCCPAGHGQGKGNPITEEKPVLRPRRVSPACRSGGTPSRARHKGYGLALMPEVPVDVLPGRRAAHGCLAPGSGFEGIFRRVQAMRPFRYVEHFSRTRCDRMPENTAGTAAAGPAGPRARALFPGSGGGVRQRRRSAGPRASRCHKKLAPAVVRPSARRELGVRTPARHWGGTRFRLVFVCVLQPSAGRPAFSLRTQLPPCL